MPARSTKSALDWIRRGAFGAAVAMAFQIPACGGMVIDSNGERGDASVPGQGGYGGTGPGTVSDPGRPPIGAAGVRGIPSKPTCGNGKLDPGEACDGNQLGGATCAAATMGTRPAGTVNCSSACTFDMTGCVTANYATGGVTGVGGFRGAGGFYGAGGARSVDACYTSNGVPVAGGCAYGNVATNQCLGRTSQPSGGCTQSCGCNVCPGPYTRCLLDGGCNWIFTCAQSTGCSSLKECYATSCSSIIDRAGGLNSAGAHYADVAFSCLAQNGCSVSCNGLL
jgi:hypothetical protein